MRRPVWTFQLLLLVFLALTPRSASGQSNSNKTESMTGCLDEQPGPQYVLRDEKELGLIALLEPVGFPAEDFAKYVGQRVSVTGTRSSKDGTPLMKVRSIKKLAETCGGSG
jgi:Protein of unknown function (DUF5818)